MPLPRDFFTMAASPSTQTDYISTDTNSLRAVAKAFCSHTTAIPDDVVAALRTLTGSPNNWTVTYRPASENEPHGALLFDHPQLDDISAVYVSSTDIDTPRRSSTQPVTYDVFNPMETDILTVKDDLENPVRAVQVAVTRANSEYERHHTRASNIVSRISKALRP